MCCARTARLQQLHPRPCLEGRHYATAFQPDGGRGAGESIAPDDLVIAACERLNIADYSIALDDYVANDRRESMVPLADIIKVDFERTTPQERAQLVKKQGGLRCRIWISTRW